MEVKIIEAGNGFNWGKFLVMRPDENEWARGSAVPIAESGLPPVRSLLAARGWAPYHIIVFDLETNEGASFTPGGLASADLNKHQIWVCPMYEPFLEWLYKQDLTELSKLPDYVHLDAPSAMAGYRRPGPNPR
jgi:hypothetical protein